MSLYTMHDAYETAEFKRRKPMTARAKQAISRALKGKRRRRGGGMSLTGRTAAGKAVRALGAAAVVGAAARYGRGNGRGQMSADLTSLGVAGKKVGSAAGNAFGKVRNAAMGVKNKMGRRFAKDAYGSIGPAPRGRNQYDKPIGPKRRSQTREW